MKALKLHPVFYQINPVIDHRNAVCPQAVGLFIGAAEGKGTGEFSLGIDDAVAGDVFRIRILMQGIAHGACHFGLSRHGSHLPIGGDTALWNPFHCFIDPLRGTVGDEIIALRDHAPDIRIGNGAV